MDGWKTELKKGISCENPIFIEGLPGIGNVGKVVIDTIIEKLGAEEIGTFESHNMPNSVFVNEEHLVQLPSIQLYRATVTGQDFLFLTGDAQPSQERASYELAEELLSVIEEFDGKHIVTLGGIGLNEIPDDPGIYVTGNDKGFIKEFEKHGASSEVYGVVGPIIGISGLLLGLAKNRRMKSAALLGETYGHPMYIGLKEARKIILLFNEKYDFDIDLGELDEEIEELEREMQSQEGTEAPDKMSKARSKKLSKKLAKYQDLNYIG
ncbi:MAG: PAC2 family protein [Candidatus Woesearchaeota archaeon]